MSESIHSRYYRSCRHCRYRVYEKAKRCPHCGHQLRWNWKPVAAWVIGGIIAVVLSFALVDWLTVGDSRAPTLNQPDNR